MKNIFIYIFKHKPFKLYNYYKEASDVFEEPILKWRFGLWKNDPCLPVWRRGPIIHLYRRFSTNIYNPRTGVRIKTGSKGDVLPDGSIRQYDKYETTHHNLPGKLKQYRPAWKCEFRKKLRKWGLGWWPTNIQLPIFFAFECMNYDMCWKNKWDEYRYEFPPQFTLVFFGLSLSFWLVNPTNNTTHDSDYWESILYYLDYKDLKKVDTEMGVWIHNIGKDNEYKEKRLKIEFLKEPYKLYKDENKEV